MRVKCVICDNIGQLPDDLPLAKTLGIAQSIRICVKIATIELPKKQLHESRLVISFFTVVHIQSKKFLRFYKKEDSIK